jgi:hypothetical protein
MDARLLKMDARLLKMDARLLKMDARLLKMDARLLKMDASNQWTRGFVRSGGTEVLRSRKGGR